jgi:hypothetical protein
MSDDERDDVIQLLLDEAAIRRVLQRYVRGTDRSGPWRMGPDDLVH